MSSSAPTAANDRPAELPPEKAAHRSVTLRRDELAHYTVTNARGGTLSLGGEHDFTPVELLLAGIAGCTSIDVDYVTTRRSEPDAFEVEVTAQKVADELGNHLQDITVTFRVSFPEGDAGDAARERLPQIVHRSHDRLCTVSRTIETGQQIETVIE